MPTIRLSDLVYDYLQARKEGAEHTNYDSAMRDVLREADPDWQAVAEEHRQQRDEGEGADPDGNSE